jgi:metal-responsive CopG/Arc/MetJ family transcriptional regulator
LSIQCKKECIFYAKLKPSINPSKKIRMDITIDPELQERMIKVCQAEERSMSNLITVALKQYISNYEKGAK